MTTNEPLLTTVEYCDSGMAMFAGDAERQNMVALAHDAKMAHILKAAHEAALAALEAAEKRADEYQQAFFRQRDLVRGRNSVFD